MSFSFGTVRDADDHYSGYGAGLSSPYLNFGAVVDNRNDNGTCPFINFIFEGLERRLIDCITVVWSGETLITFSYHPYESFYAHIWSRMAC
jgi:hypothetical protein